MAIQLQGNSGTLCEVDPTWRAIRTALRPLDPGNLGQYKLSAQSGLITGGSVTAGAPLFSCRWGTAQSNGIAVITYLKATMVVTTVFSNPQELGLALFFARSFSASDGAGTSLTPTANNQKARTSMGTSLFTDMRISAITLLTAGTRTLDANPMAFGMGFSNFLNPTLGVPQVSPYLVVLEFVQDVSKGEMPIILDNNTGLVLNNTIAFTAAGAVRLSVQMAWSEVLVY